MIHDVVPEHKIWEPVRLPCTNHPHDVEAVSSRHTKVGNAGLMPWHPTVWPMVKGVNPWSSSRAVASLYSAHICRRVCRRYAGRLITTSPRQAIAGQVCCDSHAMPPTPLGRLDSPNANPPILPSPGRKRARLSAAPRWRRARPLPCGGSESRTSPGPSSILCSPQSNRTR